MWYPVYPHHGCTSPFFRLSPSLFVLSAPGQLQRQGTYHHCWKCQREEGLDRHQEAPDVDWDVIAGETLALLLSRWVASPLSSQDGRKEHWENKFAVLIFKTLVLLAVWGESVRILIVSFTLKTIRVAMSSFQLDGTWYSHKNQTCRWGIIRCPIVSSLPIPRAQNR